MTNKINEQYLDHDEYKIEETRDKVVDYITLTIMDGELQ